MYVAAIQMNSQDNKEENLGKAEKFIDEAASKGASLVVLPELFNYLGLDENMPSQSEYIPGLTIERMITKAQQYKIFVLCGSILEKDKNGDRSFNTSVLIDPSGKIIAKYRKIHLFDVEIEGGVVYQESAFIKPGNKVVTVNTKLATFGLSICYDLRFPELYRRLSFNGAQIIFIPAAFTLQTGKDHWEALIRARAIENQAYVIAPNQVGFHPKNNQCYGKSIIVDPWGTVMAKASDREMVIYAELDLMYQEKIKEKLPSLLHKREDIFSF